VNARPLPRSPADDGFAAPALVADLLSALCDESEALKRGDPAALAAAASRKRHLLRLMTSTGVAPAAPIREAALAGPRTTST
jgi:hypothetical protein